MGNNRQEIEQTEPLLLTTDKEDDIEVLEGEAEFDIEGEEIEPYLPKFEYAEDAIPLEGIWLTEAYTIVADLIEKEKFKPALDEEWQEKLEKSERKFLEESDRERIEFDIVLSDADKLISKCWRARQVAKVAVRLGFENTKLTPCVRDPSSGQILRLGSEGWFGPSMLRHDYVPDGTVFSDHVSNLDEAIDSPGPNGNLIQGKFRPVFLIRSEFETWFQREIAGAEESLSQTAKSSEPAISEGGVCSPDNPWNRPRDHKVRSVIVAIETLGASALKGGQKDWLLAINTQLKKMKKPAVSLSTALRALERMR
jgi:hypothetical protein